MAGSRTEMIIEGVDRLLDGSPAVKDIEAHHLQLLAGRRWRARGHPLPRGLVEYEQGAAAYAMAVPAVLERVRAAAEGPLLLVKGPEVARHYPDPGLRFFRDLDLVVPDAEAVQAQLIAAGFEPTGEPEIYEGIHHLRPLEWRGLPLVVEVHHRPKWIDGLHPPSVSELLGLAVPAAAGVDGILALPPEHHAVLLAAHAWAHRPLTSIRDLLDVALAAAAADPGEPDRVAEAWGVGRMWRTTIRAAEGVLLGGRRTAPLRIWARHLATGRERTVLESHAQRLASAFWCHAPARALAVAGGAMSGQLLPENGEGWRAKSTRTRTALGNAFVRKSQHDEELTLQEEQAA